MNKKSAMAKLNTIALYLQDDTAIIYDGYKLSQILPDLEEWDEEGLKEAFNEVILGMAFWTNGPRTCGKVLEIKEIAAEKGYGPVLYDLAMSLAKEKGYAGLVPDRKKVSMQAQKVWEYYAYRRPDVTWKPLPPNCPSHKGEDVLNSVYTINRPMNYDVMERRHMLIMRQAVSDQEVVSDIHEYMSLLSEVAHEYFSMRFNG